MTLEDLGYSREMECFRKEQQLDAFGVGRVTAVHRERYVVKTAEREYEGEIIGNLRFTARNQADFPVVGDWVAISEYDEGKVLIHAVFPRKTVIERQAAGKQGEKQIIASNIDYALIVQAGKLGQFGRHVIRRRWGRWCGGRRLVRHLRAFGVSLSPVGSDVLIPIGELLRLAAPHASAHRGCGSGDNCGAGDST